MNQARAAFSLIYVALGIAIIVRLLHYGVHREIFGGIVLGLVMVAFGVYRIMFYLRMRRIGTPS
ncbi:MAG: hypothetical protein JO018_06335 [Candidatus Eremiobacteraeota bacterium]|nr:hypothetical protein [Candidatus Eremiobacteraeota bacterium]MBV9971981.1 hypothetical protein [Candidatus Eremiobacteraeota bacterium]